jgi:hypothetical protein
MAALLPRKRASTEKLLGASWREVGAQQRRIERWKPGRNQTKAGSEIFSPTGSFVLQGLP